jgi:hypothetical protein
VASGLYKNTGQPFHASLLLKGVFDLSQNSKVPRDECGYWWRKAVEAIEEAAKYVHCGPNERYRAAAIRSNARQLLSGFTRRIGPMDALRTVQTADYAPERFQDRLRTVQGAVEERFAQMDALLEAEEHPDPGQK